MAYKIHRSYIASFLLIFMLFLTIGSYGLIYVLKFRIRASVHAMIKTMSDEELVPISRTYIPGAEDEDEILIEGKFYDVAKYRIKGDTIIYYCYYDKAETNLTQFSSHWHDQQSIKHKREQLARFLKISDIKYVNSFSLLHLYLKPTSVLFSTKTIFIPILCVEVHTPPPQFA